MKAVAPPPTVASVFNALRRRLPEIRALFLVREDGELVERAALRSPLDPDIFTHEYLPVLQIVRRASDDMGAGEVNEHITVSDSAVVLARQGPSKHYSIVVASPGVHLGRLRFEVRRMAWELERCLAG